MGKYNKLKFGITTLPRRILLQIDALKKHGESRADVITRLLEYYKGNEIIKTPEIVQTIGSLILAGRKMVLPTPNCVVRKREVIGRW